MAFYNSGYCHNDFSEYDSYDSTTDDFYYESAQTEPSMTNFSYEPSFYNLLDYPPPRHFGEAYDPGTADACSPSIFNQPKMIECGPNYHGAYDSAVSYPANAGSTSNFSELKVIECDPNYHGAYGSAIGYSGNAYSAFTFSVPKVIDYDPNCNGAYGSAVRYSANAYSTSNFSELRVIEYDPNYHGAYGSAISYSANACSASTFSAPKVIEYDPNYCGDSYQKVSTQFAISYSVSEFNEPEFEEYDPTPYGGGYDISQTYGKPLPPSNEICYPPSSSSAPKAPPSNDVYSKGSTEMQNGKVEKAEEEAKERIEEKTKPSNGSKPTQIHEDNDEPASERDTASEGGESRETDGVSLPDLGSGYENGRGAERDYDYGRPVNQFPSGYGLEAMDLCETLFGYWPCLSRIKKQTDCRQAKTCEVCRGNQWQTAADYLFGSFYPYPHG